MIIVVGLGWMVAAVFGYLWHTKTGPSIQLPAPLDGPALESNSLQPNNVPFGHIWLHDTNYRVVQTTPDGRRARIMFERGTPGPSEILELFDGPECRGRKSG